MNTQLLGIPSSARPAGGHLIPTRKTITPSLIEQLTASHIAVLEKWKRKFGLDLYWHSRGPGGLLKR